MPPIAERARPAREADIAVLEELVQGAVAELAEMRGGSIWSRLEARRAPFADSLRDDLRADDVHVIVGTIDEAVVGFAAVRLRELHDGTLIGSVDDIYVMPDARGVGVGEAMMESLLRWASERGCHGVDSLALPGDRATKNFFESHGLVARAIVVHRRIAGAS